MPKLDAGHKEADDQLKRMERKLRREYTGAYKGMKKKTDEYFEQFFETDKHQLELLNAGKITKEDYLAWRAGKMARGEQYETFCRELARDLTNTNILAAQIVNGGLIDAYVANFNYAGYEICKEAGLNISFNLVDHATVERLIRDNPRLSPKLPNARVNRTKDEQWNIRKVRSALTQGILEGDSIPNMAKRLQSVASMNNAAATRNARTMVTGAENAGRIDRYHEAQELGIELQKTWMATADDRTRDAHIELDGVSVGIDEPFENSIGEIMFPADPACPDPENCYNCRCTLVSTIKGYSRDFSQRDMSKLGGISYEEWKKSVGK